jgi:Tfp pilus assembly protein PilO
MDTSKIQKWEPIANFILWILYLFSLELIAYAVYLNSTQTIVVKEKEEYQEKIYFGV